MSIPAQDRYGLVLRLLILCYVVNPVVTDAFPRALTTPADVLDPELFLLPAT